MVQLDLETHLRACAVVPVITIDDAHRAADLGAALIEGGLPVAEVTFRTPAAAEAIRILRESHPSMLVGAGTVLDLPTLDLAVAAGARFVVAPGFNPAVVQRCLDLDIPIVPGVSNPTDIEAALAFGLRLLKFFPAEAAGGITYLAAVSAPYQGVSFMPTGGIDRATLPDYLSRPFVAACGGTWIATRSAIDERRFDEIADNAREAAALAAPYIHLTETSRT